MEPLFDLLLLLAGLSGFFALLGLVAGIAERSLPFWEQVRRLSGI